jgi:hypothetical protein
VKPLFFVLIYSVTFLPSLPGQEMPDTNPDTNIDIDALFDENAPETPPASGDLPRNPAVSAQPAPVPQNAAAKKTGFSISADYDFTGGFFPGWSEAPWTGNDAKQTQLPGIIMASSLGFDFQISDNFFARNVLTFSFPYFTIAVSDFYFDYTINKRVFIRAGKTKASWGISPNYAYTNLLVRSPSKGQYGSDFYYLEEGEPGKADKSVIRYTAPAKNETYIIKTDIPLGIGGIQFITMVHDDFFTPTNIQRELIAAGGKFNMAFTWADIDLGFLYQDIMPLRGFVSVKTTLGSTELYAEALAAAGNTELYNDGLPTADDNGNPRQPTGRRRTWDQFDLSGSIGIVQPFFDNKLRINGEFFYNGEEYAFWVTEEDVTKKIEQEVSPFIKGVNLAFNISYKPRRMGFNFFLNCLYGVGENTAQLVPGFTFSPLSHITIAVAVPMALGSPEGTYYKDNADRNNRPFSIALAVSFGGQYKYGHYE